MFVLLLISLVAVFSAQAETEVSDGVLTTESAVATSVAPDYDQLVADTLSNIDAIRSSLSSTVATALPVLQNILTVAANLLNNLPNAIISDRLSQPLARLDAISNIVSGSSDAFCFQNYATTKSNILSQARQTFTTCTSTITTATNQLITNINRNITTLNSLAATAKQRVAVCGSNTMYRLDPTLFTYCMTSATSAFNSQVSTLNEGVTSLQTLRKNNIDTLATCIASAVIRAENLLQGFNDYVKSCLSTSEASVFTSIIANVQDTKTSSYINQLTATTSTISSLNTAQALADSNLKQAITEVNNAYNAKSLTAATAKAALEKTYANVSAAFSAAANAFANNLLARSCVTNIRNALATNLNTQSNQIYTCVRNIPSTVSTELLQLQATYSQLLAKQALNTVQCLGQVSYFFITNGITNCLEDSEGDETLNYNFLASKATTLTQASVLVSSAANNCYNQGSLSAARQTAKDKFACEICIFKTTRKAYPIII